MSTRKLWVVECWAPLDPTWSPYYHSKHPYSARKEMASAKRACPDCKFRLVAYTPEKSR